MPLTREQILAMAEAAAVEKGIDVGQARRLVQNESAGDPYAFNISGATGPTQLKPATIADPGYGVQPMSPMDIHNPEKNIGFGLDYYNAMQRNFAGRGNGDAFNAAAAYLMGPGAYEDVLSGKRQLTPQEIGYAERVSGQKYIQPPLVPPIEGVDEPLMEEAASQVIPEGYDYTTEGEFLDEEPGFFERLMEGASIDVNAGLASLGKLLVDLDTGNTPDLTDIGVQYRRQRRYDDKIRKEEQARENQVRALVATLDPTDPDQMRIMVGLQNGLAPETAVEMLAALRAREHDLTKIEAQGDQTRQTAAYQGTIDIGKIHSRYDREEALQVMRDRAASLSQQNGYEHETNMIILRNEFADKAAERAHLRQKELTGLNHDFTARESEIDRSFRRTLAEDTHDRAKELQSLGFDYQTSERIATEEFKRQEAIESRNWEGVMASQRHIRALELQASGHAFEDAQRIAQNEFNAQEAALGRGWNAQQAALKHDRALELQKNGFTFEDAQRTAQNEYLERRDARLHENAVDLQAKDFKGRLGLKEIDLTYDKWVKENQFEIDWAQMDQRDKELQARIKNWSAEDQRARHIFEREMAFRIQKYQQDLSDKQDAGAAGKQLVSDLLSSAGMHEMADQVRQYSDTAFADTGRLQSFLKAASDLTDDKKGWTSKMREAAWLANDHVPQTMKDAYINAVTAASGNDPGAKAAAFRQEELIKADMKHLTTMRKSMEKANQRKTIITRMQQLNEQIQAGNITTGNIVDNALFKSMEGALASLGMLDGDWKTAQGVREQFAQLHNVVFPSLRPEGSGQTSNWEGTIYAASWPGIGNTPATLDKQLEFYNNYYNQMLTRTNFIDAAISEGSTFSDASKAWQKKVDAGDVDTNAVHYNMSTITKDNFWRVIDAHVGDVQDANGEALVENGLFKGREISEANPVYFAVGQGDEARSVVLTNAEDLMNFLMEVADSRDF